MRRAKTEKGSINRLRASVVLLALATMLLSPLAYGARPYFKAYGADVFTGGWFDINDDDGDSCSSGSHDNYQDSIAGPAQRGGIVAFSKSTATGLPTGGSSSQFAAVSAGLIDGSNASSPPRGFYSSGATGGSFSVKRLSLANDDGSAHFGGRVQGSVRQGHCIPDYYTTKSTSAIPFSGTTTPDVSTATGSYINSSPTGTVAINSVGGVDTIPPGNELTIFVNGNVYIHQNITYSSASTASNVPKFTLVARGNIYIERFVTRLDGLYIAQPNPSVTPQVGSTANTGIIWTCHNGASAPTLVYAATCTNKLTINGALIAKQVNLLRINGDIAAAAAVANEGAASGNIAEVINYTPAMVLGGPFFNPSPSTGAKIQSLTSLPPVF